MTTDTKQAEPIEVADAPAAGSLVPAVQYIPIAPPGTIRTSNEESLRNLIPGSLWSELFLIPKMYFDPRYRLSRLTQVGMPVIVLLMIANYLFFTYSLTFIPAFPPLAERLVLIVLAIVLYRLLTKELVRYKQVLDYLTKYG